MKEVNAYREGKKYSHKEAAKQIQQSANKKPLTKSPFVIEFEYGTKGEGYWTYEHMSVQFEDCVDCIKVLYPQYDFIFLFDHSCGYDRQCPDGLSANQMKKNMEEMCCK